MASTDAEAEAIRRRLDLVGGEISGLRSQLRDLRLRTNYAVVNVTLAEAKKDSGSLGSFGDSLDDAGNLLAGFAGLTIRVLALALPLGADRAARLAGRTRGAPPAPRVRAGLTRAQRRRNGGGARSTLGRYGCL